ncbi:MAG: transposase [Cyclobacteriaceae bacterium]
MTRKKYTAKFKTKVVLEAIKEHSTVADLAQKYDLAPQQINLWKREFLANADSLFEGKAKSKKSQQDEEKDHLLKIIGEQKVQIDFLNNALR